MRKIPLFARPDNSGLPRITGLYALVDDADYWRLMRAAERWFCGGKNKYPCASATNEEGRRVSIFMHKFIMYGFGRGPVVDHKDRNTLNCQRSNLRQCTRAQNAMNSSPRPQRVTMPSRYGKHAHRQMYGPPAPRPPYRGIARLGGGKWAAICTANNVRHYGGTFSTPEEAARAYDALALQHHGEFAVLNFGVAW